MTLHDTKLRSAIASSSAVRDRLAAVVYNARWADASSSAEQLTAEVNYVDLGWAVASNPAIFEKIKSALDAEDPNIPAAIDAGLDDVDLTYALLAVDGTGAVARLQRSDPPA